MLTRDEKCERQNPEEKKSRKKKFLKNFTTRRLATRERGVLDIVHRIPCLILFILILFISIFILILQV